jgi:hypothetical protein
VVASIRRWSENDLVELEEIARAMEKRRSRSAKERKRRPRG